jgi:hypothetical protein
MGGEGGCHAALRYQVQSSDVVEMGAEDVCKLFRATERFARLSRGLVAAEEGPRVEHSQLHSSLAGVRRLGGSSNLLSTTLDGTFRRWFFKRGGVLDLQPEPGAP